MTTFLRLWRLGLLLALLMPAVAAAQQSEGPNYRAWESTVDRVSRVIDDGGATEAELTNARRSVAVWRSRFADAEEQNVQRLETLNRQLQALGPPPAEGESEPEEIEARRTTLQRTIADAEVPRLRASEAFNQADGLIAEIDLLLRERQAVELLQRFPTPLNPLNWADVLGELLGTLAAIPAEIRTELQSPGVSERMVRKLPVTLGLILLSLALFVRGQVWTDWLEERVDTMTAPAWRMLAESSVLLLQLIVPWLGLMALLTGLRYSGLPGDVGRALLTSLPVAGLVLIVGYWLVRRLFPVNSPRTPPLPVSPELCQLARPVGVLLVFVLCIGSFVEMFLFRADLGGRTQQYIDFAIMVPLAVLLYRLGHILYRVGRIAPGSGENADSLTLGQRALWFGGQAARLAAIAGLAVGATGHIPLMELLLVATILTMATLSAVALLQRLTARLFSIVTTGEDVAADHLLPTLVGGVLVLAALPLIALIWGMRVTDLTELWATLRQGITFGDTRISPQILVTLITVFVAGFAATRLVQGVLRSTILPKTQLDQGARTALVSGVGYIGVLLAALAAVTIAGLNLSSLAIVAGALSVGIGFGLQTIVSNFVSGIILLVERPVSEGDWIEVGGQMGVVRRIAVRATVIETFDRTDVIVPNSDLVSGRVTNWTRGNLVGRVIVPVSVAYGTDTAKVEEILEDIAMEHPMVVLQPAPAILFLELNRDGMLFEIRAILRDINYLMDVRSQMNHQIVRRFREEGIEIPFSQRDIWLRNPEALRLAARAPEEAAEGDGGAAPQPRTIAAAEPRAAHRPAASLEHTAAAPPRPAKANR